MAKKRHQSLRPKSDLYKRKKVYGGLGWTERMMNELAEMKQADKSEQSDKAKDKGETDV